MPHGDPQYYLPPQHTTTSSSSYSSSSFSPTNNILLGRIVVPTGTCFLCTGLEYRHLGGDIPGTGNPSCYCMAVLRCFSRKSQVPGQSDKLQKPDLSEGKSNRSESIIYDSIHERTIIAQIQVMVKHEAEKNR